MKIEDVSEAMEKQLEVEYVYMGMPLRYRINGCITRYNHKKNQWYYVLELMDKSGGLLVARLEDVRVTKSEVKEDEN
ncbi:MAG: hypothetical protein ACI4J7_09355 [Ruminiclostridium sp.]